MPIGGFNTNKIVIRNVSASTAGQKLLGWTSVPPPGDGCSYRLFFWITICAPTTGVAGAVTQQCRVTYSMEDPNVVGNEGSCVPSGSFVIDSSGAYSSVAATQGKIRIAGSSITYPVKGFKVDTSASTCTPCYDPSILTPSSAYTIWYGAY